MARSSPPASACVLITAAMAIGVPSAASAQEIVIGPYHFADETPFADAAAFHGNRSPEEEQWFNWTPPGVGVGEESLIGYQPHTGAVNLGMDRSSTCTTPEMIDFQFIDMLAVNGPGPDVVIFDARYSTDDYEVAVRPRGGVMTPRHFYESAGQRETGASGPGSSTLWGVEVDLSDYGIPPGVEVDLVRVVADCSTQPDGYAEPDPMMAAVLRAPCACSDDNECTWNCGLGGTCVSIPQDPGTPCTGGVCNGDPSSPACVECVDDEHCPAGRPRCDMTQNTCVECLADSECDDGSPCTVEGCEDGVCRVEAAPAGTPCADGICNGVETAPHCVECLADAMCDDGLECTDDLCRDSVCTHPASPAGTPCSIGRCDADEVAPRCRECASDAECGEFARYCSPEGRCTRCRDDAHCEDENPCTIDACAGGECVFSPVAAGTPCGAGTCNGDSRAPVCEECARDIECDDGDACTRDGCRLGVCVHLPACVDAGVDTRADAGPPVPTEHSGCACRAAGSGARSGAPLPLFALLVLLIARAGRRRRAAR